MSHNQSRAERSESTQYRKTGRSGSSNQQRQFTGGVSTKGGGGASAAPNNPSNRSFKKYNSNSQVGQPSARSPNVDSTNPPAARAVQNGAHEQQPTHGIPDSPVASNSSNVKPMDATTKKFTRDVPKALPTNVSSAALPSSVSTASSEFKAPSTPGKAPGDASKSFPLQFGSISPGFMNGMQIPARTSSAPPNLDEQKKAQVPARTSSAPPNLDEQKKAQARHESLRSAPAMPIPSIPKQNLPKKDAGSREQPNTGDAQLASKSKRDAQVSAAPPVSQAQKPSVHPIPGMTMPLPFHQPPVCSHTQCSLRNDASGTKLELFTTNGSHTSSVGKHGNEYGPQFPQQPAVKFSGSRKTVKITHPETHEELRLESSPALSSTQVPPSSQPPRSYNQVTVKPPSRGEKEPLSSLAQTKPGLAKSYASAASSGPVNVQRDVSHTSTSTLSPVDGSGSASTISADEARTGTVSAKDNHKKLGNRSQQDQVGKLSAFVSSSPSELPEAEAMEAKSASSGINMVSEAAKESLSAMYLILVRLLT
ncbi:UNVERIFIED_CONTAM: Eukaryotic translation initiation factor 4G [Sesamum radiatum]|uniref:Eukaryotic translation initiation factor 4G n=1 Tax=Sesamum radiatum TaxID=300843 RepID=A0AAW2V8U1_SESRA